MKLIDREWNEHLGKYQRVWLANDPSDIKPGFDPDAAEGSMIIVISTQTTYMKNCDCQWQKCGSTEVL